MSLRTEKLLSFRTLCFVQVLDIQFVRILINSFCPVSISVIGLIFRRLPPHVSFFRIRITIACIHSVRMLYWMIQLSISAFSSFLNRAGAFFYISFGILDGLGLLFIGRDFKASSNSSSAANSFMACCICARNSSSLISWRAVPRIANSAGINCCSVSRPSKNAREYIPGALWP